MARKKFQRRGLQYRVILSSEGGQPVSSTRVPLRQLQQRDRFFQNNPGKQAIRKLLVENLKKMAGRDFGRLIVNRASVFTYERQIGMWSLLTAFEPGGHVQLRYLHVVHALPGGKMGTNISNGISILNWTGILAEEQDQKPLQSSPRPHLYAHVPD